jgi:hypothetical protein
MDASTVLQVRRAPRRRGPTRGDILLLAALVLAVPALRYASAGGSRVPGGVLVVRCGDAPELRLDARRDGDFDLHGPQGETLLRLRGGEAWIAAAPCRNQLCRRMGRISRPGRALVCLPNRVLVRFVGAAPDVDGITR